MKHFLLFFLFAGFLFLALPACHQGKKTYSFIPDSGLYSKEINELNRQLAEDSTDAELYYQRGSWYLKRSDLVKALSDINYSLLLDSSNSKAYSIQADIYLQKNETRKAKQALEKAIAADSANTDALIKLAQLHLYVQQYKESMHQVDLVLKQNAHVAQAYFIKGILFKESGDTLNAISSFQTTTEQQEDYYAAYIQLGLLHAARKNKLAEDYYTTALRINPESTEALYNRGIWYQQSGQIKKAVSDYKSITQMNGSNKNTWFNLGYLYQFELHLPDSALYFYGQAINSEPMFTEALYNSGLVCEEQGKLDKAKAFYKRALDVDPDFEQARKRLKHLSK